MAGAQPATVSDLPAAPLQPGRRPSPQVAQLKRTFYFLRRNTLALVGIGILLFMIAVALYSPLYPAPSDSLTLYCGTYGNPNPSGCNSVCTYASGTPPPSPNCIAVDQFFPSLIGPTVTLSPFATGPLALGSITNTPENGYFYNLEAGLIKGAPWSLGISAAVVAAGASIGLVLGAAAGYLGGYSDEVIMRFTDIFLAIPGLLLLIVILATLGSAFPGLLGRLGLLLFAFIITDWPIYTRIVRGQVLVTREQKYVEAAKASGAKSGRILLRHIVPNSMYPVFVQMSLDVGTIPLSLGVLVFLGFSIFPSPWFPEWGNITAHSVNTQFLEGLFNYCETAPTCVFPWWQVFIPGLTLFAFGLAVNFISDGLRDALDPRLRR